MADGYAGGLVMSFGGDFLYLSCLYLVGNGVYGLSMETLSRHSVISLKDCSRYSAASNKSLCF